jgi:hypothetical protein
VADDLRHDLVLNAQHGWCVDGLALKDAFIELAAFVKKLGRPRLNGEIERKAERQLRKGHGLNKIAKTLGIGVGTVVRIKAEMPPDTQASECPR